MVDAGDPEVVLPVALTGSRPTYPPLARQRLIEGSVEVRLRVDETGAVTDAVVTRADPPGVGFEDAALRFAEERRYRPATKAGVPVQVWITILVRFRRPAG